MSKQERISWIQLVVHAVIGSLYFGHILRLPADADLWGPHTAYLSVHLITVAVLLAVACEIALRVVQRGAGPDPDRTPLDERDSRIALLATRNAHFVLTGGVILTLVQAALLEWTMRFHGRHPAPATILERLGAGPLETMHVMQLLLAALWLAALTLAASRIFHYRRGY